MDGYIFIIDPVAENYLELSKSLKNHRFNYIITEDITKVHTRFYEFKKSVKLIIWSIYSGDNDEFEQIKKFKKLCRDIPIIIISPLNDRHVVFKAYKAGAADYIIMPFNEEFIINKINEHILTLTNNMNFKNPVDIFSEGKLTFSIREILSLHIKGANRGKYPASIMMLSIFKVNDTIKENPEVIIDSMIKILKSKIRETDIIINYGKSSILIILPFVDSEGLYLIEDKIMEKFMANAHLKQKAKGFILASSKDMLTDSYKGKELVLLKRLQANLQATIVFPTNI